MHTLFPLSLRTGGCGDDYKNQVFCIKQNVAPNIDVSMLFSPLEWLVISTILILFGTSLYFADRALHMDLFRARIG